MEENKKYSIDTNPIINENIAINYSNTMSVDEKINYLVQNLRLTLNNQRDINAITGCTCLDYKAFPFAKKEYDINHDDFKDEGKAVVDLLIRLNWEKEDINFEKYDISNLAELLEEEQSQLKNDLAKNTHSISLVTIDGKKFIVDCAYKQFFSSNTNIDTPSSNKINQETFMLRDEKSKQLSEQILKYGFIEATPENLKTYMDGFIFTTAKDEYIKTPTAEEYQNKVKGQILSIISRVQHKYNLTDLWKVYLKKIFPDNSDKTLNFIDENKEAFFNIKNELDYCTDSFYIIMIDDKKYIRTKDADIDFTLNNLKEYLDTILIQAEQEGSKFRSALKQKKSEKPNHTIVTPSIDEYLKLYPCDELSLNNSNYIIESKPYIANDDFKFENFNEQMSDEEKLTNIVQKERKYLMKNWDLVHESLAGECANSAVRVILDCTSKGFNDAIFLAPSRYLKGTHHNCTIANLNENSYLIDCTYRQFFTKYNKSSNCGTYMLKNEKMKEVANQILKYGFIKATPENLKAYMDGYEMAKNKSFDETGISAEEYLKILKEDETFPINIVTNAQIVESDMKKEITSKEIENAKKLLFNLENSKENENSLIV